MRIPLLTVGFGAQAKRAGEIEHAWTPRGQNRRDFGGERLRDREKDGVRFSRQQIEVEWNDRVIPDPGERRDLPSR